jgi:soluble lytic murein transglycosylase-like protein
LALSSVGLGAEVAELRNGFNVPHRSREFRNGSVRLYTDEAKKSFVDIPADQIQSFSTQPDPPPLVEAAPQVKAGQQHSITAAQNASATQVASTPPAPAKRDAGVVASKATEQIVHEASQTQGVDSDFIDSVIKHESAGNPHAVSRAGARGLMQLMPGTAARLGVSDSFSPEQNVHGGARYLRELLEKYNGDAVKALAAYNAGPGAVDRYRGVPPYRETRLYVQRIVREYNRKKQNAARAPQTARSTSRTTPAARAAMRDTKTVFVAKANAAAAASNGNSTANN